VQPEAADPLWDLVVVGGGPAGSAAALAALRERPDARVLVLDAAAFPRDKTCGDGVAAEVVDEAAALGVRRLTDGCVPVPRLSVQAPGGAEASGAFARPAWVVPRLVLDARLLAAARAAGAVVRRERVRALSVGPAEARVGEHRARAVVAADGAHSTVRRLLGIPPNPPRALAVAVRAYAPSPGPEQRVLLVREGWPAYAWSFPIGDGRANVGFGALRPRLPAGDPRWLHRRLAALLPGAGDRTEPGTLRAAHLPLSSWRPRQPAGRVLLAGDAASLVNPLTGEGIWYAVVSGRLAGAAAVAGGPDPAAAYRAALARALGAHLATTGLLARLSRGTPRLVDAAVGAAAGDRGAFVAVVALGLAGGLVSPRLAARVGAELLRAAR